MSDASIVQRVDNNMRATWKSNLINRWLGVRLDYIGTLLVGTTAAVAVFAQVRL
jgi:hypothetical protein